MSSSACLPFNLATLDCRNSTGWCLRPYGDVSGFGVIVGFKGTGYYVALLLIAYYVTAFDPRRNPFEPEGMAQTTTTSWEPNPIDIMAVKWIRKRAMSRWTSKSLTRFGDCLVISILQLCDIQAFTGMAILIGGFISLSAGISAYHWQMIGLLAWFSSITHLSGLTVLRYHPSNRQSSTNMRMILMFVLLVLLLVAVVPTGYFSWGDSPFQDLPSDESRKFMSSPAICYLRLDSGTWDIWGSAVHKSSATEMGSFQSMIGSALLLLAGFSTRTVKMSRRLCHNITTGIRRPISSYVQRILILVWSRAGKSGERGLRHRIWHVVVAQPCLAVFVSFRIIADIYSSLLMEVIWIVLAIIWGTLKLRGAAAQLPQDIFDQENDWTFGQIVPVLLLAVPIFATAVNFVSNGTVPDYSNRDDHDTSGVERPDDFKPYPLGSQSSELSGILNDVYTSRTPWLWPSLVGLYLCTIWFTYQAFSQNFDLVDWMQPYGSLVEVWFTHFGLLWYMVLGVPCIFSSMVATGLALDSWFQSPSKLVMRTKVCVYLFMVVIQASAFAISWLSLVFMGFQSYLFENLYMSNKVFERVLLHIFICVLLALAYYICYVLVAITVQVCARKEVKHTMC